LAKNEPTLAEMKQRVPDLIRQQRFGEALPLLEKLVAAEPDNPEWNASLGFAILAQVAGAPDETARQALRIRARGAFVKARDLGANRLLMESMIEAIPPDGSNTSRFSENSQAHNLMLEAESFFGQGKLDDALSRYQKALELDPALYEAALFSGDVFNSRNDFDNAEIWYQRAIAINPNRETAYRYSATPLMKQRRFEAARDRYVEAFIREPYNRLTHNGLAQYAQATRTQLGHPSIAIPVEMVFEGNGNARVEIVASMSEEDGSSAWNLYAGLRLTWIRGRFVETFPAERAYRHSLAEETEAIRLVITTAASDPKVKALNPSIAKLKRLDDEGLLEAYILLALPDEGIAGDHSPYLAENRDKLRRYVEEYVLTGGGR
jgi:tetratricopeptide (TPR) repeat protein